MRSRHSAALSAIVATVVAACGGAYREEIGPAVDAADGSADALAPAPSPQGDGGAPGDSPDSSAPVACGDDRLACVAASCGLVTCLAAAHVPTKLGAFAVAPGLQKTVVAGSATFATTTGAAPGVRGANADPSVYEVVDGIGFVRLSQPAGAPSIALWMFESLELVKGVARFTGDGAVALVSKSGVTIGSGATLDVSADRLTPGPGGALGGPTAANGAGCGGGAGSVSGGGGGALGTNGAAGGGGAAGQGCTDLSPLTTLVGGSGGGGGDDGSGGTGPFGGAGGGALQITALGVLRLDGVLVAGGGGGRTPQGNGRDGAGGGSGGFVFLEAPSIELAASAGIYANGGGGGSCSPGAGTTCVAGGSNGGASLTAARGSTCGVCAGGDGATAQKAATAGGTGTPHVGTSYGGGGGGLGRIYLRSLAPVSFRGATLSPADGSGALVVDATSWTDR